MISPELLRHYPFFGSLNNDQLRTVAMLAEEACFEKGAVIFQENEPANHIYFLLEGGVDLYYTTAGMGPSDLKKGIPVGEINPGESFGVSALIEPHVLTSTACASSACRIILIDASALREIFKGDRKLAYVFTHQAARTYIERLHSTRVQLAAAWS